ncbi:FeoA family protein [Paenarthrobacter nitroguajacolicus]|uniref:FeoA family protein n=1 Tax=Paenarthrobacter nitroguajacolicus TaxID=211146 RepID=UPI0027B9FFA6|nr:FeoA family protein [Paenarthrobacter nitroguajacolicus]
MVVRRVSDGSAEMLRYFADHGAWLAVRDRKAFSTGTTVHVNGATEDLTLGDDAADALWVENKPASRV